MPRQAPGVYARRAFGCRCFGRAQNIGNRRQPTPRIIKIRAGARQVLGNHSVHVATAQRMTILRYPPRGCLSCDHSVKVHLSALFKQSNPRICSNCSGKTLWSPADRLNSIVGGDFPELRTKTCHASAISLRSPAPAAAALPLDDNGRQVREAGKWQVS